MKYPFFALLLCLFLAAGCTNSETTPQVASQPLEEVIAGLAESLGDDHYYVKKIDSLSRIENTDEEVDTLLAKATGLAYLVNGLGWFHPITDEYVELANEPGFAPRLNTMLEMASIVTTTYSLTGWYGCVPPEVLDTTRAWLVEEFGSEMLPELLDESRIVVCDYFETLTAAIDGFVEELPQDFPLVLRYRQWDGETRSDDALNLMQAIHRLLRMFDNSKYYSCLEDDYGKFEVMLSELSFSDEEYSKIMGYVSSQMKAGNLAPPCE